MRDRRSTTLWGIVLFGFPALLTLFPVLDSVTGLGVVHKKAPVVECLEGYSRKLSSPQEISEFFDTPLVGFQNLPDDLHSQPTVEIKVMDKIVSGPPQGDCFIRIIYTEKSTQQNHVEIWVGTPASTGDFSNRTPTTWACAAEYVYTTDYQSRCTGGLWNDGHSVYVVLMTKYPIETARSMAGQLVLLENLE